MDIVEVNPDALPIVVGLDLHEDRAERMAIGRSSTSASIACRAGRLRSVVKSMPGDT